jgi:peptide/nickel transport system substrate-binding protein
MRRRTFLRLAAGATAGITARRSSVQVALGAVHSDPTLVIGSNLRIRTLDPARTIENSTGTFVAAMYDSLVKFGGDPAAPRPSLAESWTVSLDGRTYTFKLRPNLRFASGNPLTSKDVKWSLDRVINVKDITQYFVQAIDAVLAPDPLTVVIRLSAPQSAFLAILSSPSLGVIDASAAVAVGGDAGPDAQTKDRAQSYLNRHSLGSGPFILTGYIPDEEVRLARNPHHWQTAARVARIIVRHIPDPGSEQLQLERGDLDLITAIGVDQLQPLRRNAGMSVRTSLIDGTYYLVMNNNPAIGGVFAVPQVQQAVRYALDYAGILRLAGPGARRLAGVIPTGLAGCLNPAESVGRDLARARALLREANLSEVRGRLTYSASLTAWGVRMALLVQKIQSDLAEAGITIELNGLAHLPASQEYRDGRSQLGVWYWTADWLDATDFLVFLPGREVGRRAGWRPDASPDAAALAALGRRAEQESDPGRRSLMLQQYDRALMKVGPYVPLFQPAIPYAFRSNIERVNFDRLGLLDLYTISAR